MLIVAVVNQKGGVGKTTVALGLAAVAAKRGLSVVVVDLDPQANATSGMSVWNARETVATALTADRTGSIAEVIVASGWSEDDFDIPPRLAPSSPDLAGIEPHMAIDPIGAQDRLQRALVGVEADLILIDCPPSLGLLSVNGLFAADKVAIVTEPSAWALDGVEQILANVERIAARRGGEPKVAGIVVNRLARTRDARYWDAQLGETYPDLVIRPSIAHRAVIAEASAQSLPITQMHRSGAAEANAQLEAVLLALLADRDTTNEGGPRAAL